MTRYALRKFLQSVILIAVVLLINFFILRLTPGNPYDTAQYSILNSNNGKELSAAQQSALDLLRSRLSLYFDPWPQAFTQWAGGVLHFDFGHSVTTGQTFTPNLLRAALNSLWLLLFATLISLSLGVGLGLYSAYHPNGWQDKTIKIFTLLFIALPGWYMLRAFDWFNTQLWVLTGQHFSILPVGNLDRVSYQFWYKTIEPNFFLGAILMALFWGQTRTQALVVLRQDYVRTARAKGLRGGQVLFWHVFRNSLMPIISIFGSLLPFVFASQILIERFTGWDGLGEVFLSAASDRDYTVLMGVFTLLVLVCVVCSFLADLAFALVDPKLREKYRGGLILVKSEKDKRIEPGVTRKKNQLVYIFGALLTLVIMAFAVFFLIKPQAGNNNTAGSVIPQKTQPAEITVTSFEKINLPPDAQIIDINTSTGEQISFLAERFSNGVAYLPEPEQDKQKEARRTVFSTKSNALDLIKKYQQELETQGWVASKTFKNIVNTVRADYVFEKSNQYFWVSADNWSLGGTLGGNLRFNLSRIYDKVYGIVEENVTLVSVVQGFSPAPASQITSTSAAQLIGFGVFTLPSDAKIIDVSTSTGEQKSFLYERVTSTTRYAPEPNEDQQKEAKRTVYSTNTGALDIIKKYQAELQPQGWKISKSFPNIANGIKVDYVLEKNNQYFWVSVDRWGGDTNLFTNLRFNLPDIFSKVYGILPDGLNLVSVVQGYNQAGS